VLEDPQTGESVRGYPEAERVLAHLPRRGISLVLGPERQQYKPTRFAQIVRKIALATLMLGSPFSRSMPAATEA
jgi:hypothetical protein